LGASLLALLTAVSIWLSLGTVAVYGGDTSRIAALPSFWILGLLAVAAVAIARLAKLRLDQAWPLAISVVLWLPFFPGDLPPSFLMWEGPIEGIFWLCVLVGLIAARQRAMPRLLSDPAVAPWIAAAVLMASWCLVFSQVRSVIPGGDEPHYLAATQSLLHDGDLRVANNYAKGEYLDYFPGKLEPHFLKRATSGEIYSIHAPGVSVIVLPAFAIAGYLGAVATMMLIAAFTAMLTWRLAFRVSGDAGGAWAGTMAVFASAPYFFHAFTIYPEVIGSFCVVYGVSLLIDLADGRDVTSRSLVAVGSALAMLPWLHSRFAILAAVLGLLIVARLTQRRGAAAAIAKFLAVPSIAGIAWFAFFYLIWGSPSPAAPYGADTSTSASYIARGLIGLLVDQQFGVLTTAPIYLIAIAGIATLARRRPRLAIELGLIVVPYAIAVASYAMWWAGNAAPARFVVSILPLAALPIATAWPKSRIIAGFLLLLSVALLFPRAFVDSGRFIYNNRSGFDATLLWLSSSVDLPSALPSVHANGGLVAIRDAAIWVLCLGIAVVCMAATSRRAHIGAQFAIGGLILAVTVMTATRAAWSLDQFNVVEYYRSEVSAFERFRPSWQTTFVDSAWHWRSSQDFIGQVSLKWYVQPSQGIGRIPAGEYEVMAGDTTPIHHVAMFVARNDPPIDAPSLEALRASPGFRFRLPVTVRTFNLRPEPSGGAEVRLRPVGVVEPPTRRPAIRATRYGDARAFFFDDWAYPESDGFWTRANGTAEVVIDVDDRDGAAGLPISVTAGPVATSVTIATAGWRQSISLAPGQKQDMVLPPTSDGVWPIRITSGAGSRPSEREPGNDDVRALAAWIVVRR
jgi:hypothetical protein